MLIAKLFDLYSFVVLAAVILSWLPVDRRNPLAMIVRSLTDPVLGPIQRVLPPIGGLDFSPFVLIILLTLALKLIVAPIADSGYMMLL